MVHLGLMIEYEKFKAHAIESITAFVFPWKINVENLDTNSNLEWLINSRKQEVPELIPLMEEEKRERTGKRGENMKSGVNKSGIERTNQKGDEGKEYPGNKGNETIPLNPEEAQIPIQQELMGKNDLIGQITDVLIHESEFLSNLFFPTTIPGKNLRKISGTQKKNAIIKCKIPKDENIIALLDLTLKGSAKNCLVFGEKGIYFHNSIFSKGPGKRFIPYENFKNLNFALDGKYEIHFGNKNYLNVSIFGRKEEQKKMIIEVLCQLKTFSR